MTTSATKAMSKGELCNELNITYHTLSAWINLIPKSKRFGEYAGGKYTPRQVKILFDHIGHD